MTKAVKMVKTKHRFYNRLFLFNALIFVIILFIFATVAAQLSFQIELGRLQQKNRDALSAVCSYYDTKHDEFVSMVYPFYDDRDNYGMLTELLESAGPFKFEESPYVKRDIAERMTRLVARDEDVEAVFLYSNVSHKQFVYWKRFNTFEQILGQNIYTERLNQSVIGRVPLGIRTLNVTTSSVKPVVYGIASSVGTMNTRNNAGKLVIAYNNATLHRVYQKYARDLEGQCLILSDEGEIIFNSSGENSFAKYPDMTITKVNNTQMTINDKNYYILTLSKPARKYTGVMIIPVESYSGKAGSTSNIIYASCTGFAILSVLLYFIAGLRVSRRVMELENAMERVGSHNLQYRIHLTGKEDEFEHIGEYFNKMCDDLQENIGRMYIYELKQKSAELGALQARINPHFLYNSLETVRARLLSDGNEEASDMIAQLASIFRSITKEKIVYSIRQEISFIRMYLNLFSFRHAGNISFEIQLDENILEFGIMKYLLQPIVENYFIHGYEQTRDDNWLCIRGYSENDAVYLVVEDNGKGIEPDRLLDIRRKLESPTNDLDDSYGLSNVNERIRLIYGAKYGLLIESTPGEKTSIVLLMKALTCEQLETIISGPV